MGDTYKYECNSDTINCIHIHALLMKANKSETVLYGAHTFSLLLVSHSEISSCT